MVYRKRKVDRMKEWKEKVKNEEQKIKDRTRILKIENRNDRLKRKHGPRKMNNVKLDQTGKLMMGDQNSLKWHNIILNCPI